jgi:hypothetical protein
MPAEAVHYNLGGLVGTTGAKAFVDPLRFVRRDMAVEVSQEPPFRVGEKFLCVGAAKSRSSCGRVHQPAGVRFHSTGCSGRYRPSQLALYQMLRTAAQLVAGHGPCVTGGVVRSVEPMGISYRHSSASAAISNWQRKSVSLSATTIVRQADRLGFVRAGRCRAARQANLGRAAHMSAAMRAWGRSNKRGGPRTRPGLNGLPPSPIADAVIRSQRALGEDRQRISRPEAPADPDPVRSDAAHAYLPRSERRPDFTDNSA